MASTPTSEALFSATESELQRCSQEAQSIVLQYDKGEIADLQQAIASTLIESRARQRAAVRIIMK